jgi:hypothetical protein
MGSDYICMTVVPEENEVMQLTVYMLLSKSVTPLFRRVPWYLLYYLHGVHPVVYYNKYCHTVIQHYTRLCKYLTLSSYIIKKLIRYKYNNIQPPSPLCR